MQCLCAPVKEEKKKDNAASPCACVEECDHSFCVMQRMKKTTGCVDLPPKGLPWSTGLLKYLPGQRDLYRDLFLKDQEEEANKSAKQPPCRKKSVSKRPCPKEEAPSPMTCLCYCGSMNGKKGKSRGKRSKRSSRRSSTSDTASQNGGGKCKPCCVEMEQVMVCDSCNPQPRKAWIIKPCKRPEAEQAVEIAVNQQQEQGTNGGGGGVEGMICLVVPRAYLQQIKPGEEDLCAKYGLKVDDCPPKEAEPPQPPPPPPPEAEAAANEEETKSNKSKKEEPPAEQE